MIEQEITLSFVPGGILKNVYIRQYDSGTRTLRIHLINETIFEIPDGVTVHIRGTKPDGHGFSYDCQIVDAQSGIVAADVTRQMSAIYGAVKTEIVLEQSDGVVLGTAPFFLVVSKAALQDDTVISSDDYQTIKQQVQDAKDAAENAARAEGNAFINSQNAKMYFEHAYGSEMAAKTSETNSAASAAAAAGGATAADASQRAAANSQAAAAGSATAADASQRAAANSQAAAAGSATAADASKRAAADSQAAAAGSATAADASKRAAADSQAAAAGSATAADASRVAAAQSQAAAAQSAAIAQTYADKTGSYYGVDFTGSVSAGTRTGAAVGMVFAAGTDANIVKNDFDGVYPWAGMRRCACTLNTNGTVTVNAYKGQPGYAEDGSAGEVLVQVPRFYVSGRIDVNPKISMYALPGFRLPRKFTNTDGSAKQYCYLRAFTGSKGADGKLHSVAGKTGVDIMSISETLAAARLWGETYSMETDADYEVELYLMVVAMATRNAQSYLAGCTGLYSTNNVVAGAQIGAASVLVPAADKASYWPGMVISIGTGGEDGSVAAYRMVTAVEDDTATGFVRVSVDGSAFDTTTAHKICRVCESTGTTSVAATCGSNGSCTNGLHGFVFYGLENPLYGNQWRFVASSKLVDGVLYYCTDPTKYSWTSMDGYVEAGYTVPQAPGWQTADGQDERYPELVYPTAVDGGSGTFLTDYWWITASGVRISLRGGRSNDGGHGGPFGVHCDRDPSVRGWGCASSLSVPG